MLSTALPTETTTTTAVRIKSLDSSRLAPDEQKDLELESEELPNNEPETEQQSEEQEQQHEDDDNETEQATHSGLSSRASGIKDFLREKTEVKAILLKQDGSTEEISYDASSSGTRSLLGGRPSIIGEIEDLRVVVVQALSQSVSRGPAANKHTLPVPLCHHRGSGDYVVFRLDSEGRAGDVTVEEFQKYSDDHKALTETSVRNYSNEEEPVRSSYSAAKISMENLRGAVETQIHSEQSSSAVSNFEDAVKSGVQKLVDSMVLSLDSSPMNDGDYNPESEGMDEEADLVVVGSGYSEGAVDERPWRAQLDDAVEQIREIGRVHGQFFAEKVMATMYELNGSDPTSDHSHSVRTSSPSPSPQRTGRALSRFHEFAPRRHPTALSTVSRRWHPHCIRSQQRPDPLPRPFPRTPGCNPHRSSGSNPTTKPSNPPISGLPISPRPQNWKHRTSSARNGSESPLHRVGSPSKFSRQNSSIEQAPPHSYSSSPKFRSTPCGHPSISGIPPLSHRPLGPQNPVETQHSLQTLDGGTVEPAECVCLPRALCSPTGSVPEPPRPEDP